MKFGGHYLLNSNIYVFNISCTQYTWSRDLNTNFTWDNCLYRAVKLTKNSDRDKYGYSGYGIGFDSRSQFSLPYSSWDQNVIIFGADSSYSVHVDIKKKIALVLGESPTQELDNNTITEEAKYSIKRFVLSLHYNESNCFLLANETYQFKVKDSEKKF